MLVLVGSGEYLPAMEPVDRVLLAELGKRPTVVCLPTAAGTEGNERIKYWSTLGIEHFKRLNADVRALPVITRRDAQDIQLAEMVRQADFVYLSGGRPDYLLKVLQDSLVWQAIQQVLERGGILAGCSAGAMVMGARLPGFPRSRPAFNLLPEQALVVPHFDEIPDWIVPIVRFLTNPSFRLIGIPGNTALIVDGVSSKVLGQGKVDLWDRHGRRNVFPGEALKW